jgi:hypothetical protein
MAIFHILVVDLTSYTDTKYAEISALTRDTDGLPYPFPTVLLPAALYRIQPMLLNLIVTTAIENVNKSSVCRCHFSISISTQNASHMQQPESRNACEGRSIEILIPYKNLL